MKKFYLLIFVITIVYHGNVNAQTTLLTEPFTSSLHGWTAVIGSGDAVSATNDAYAGGTADEVTFVGNSQTTSITDRLYSPVINSTGYSTLTLSWNNYLSDYEGVSYPYTVSVQTSTDHATWHTSTWTYTPTSNGTGIAVGLQSFTLNTVDVGSSTLYISFTVVGETFGFNEWYIDNVLVTGTASCTAPTTQASAFTISSASSTSLTPAWTRGNGTGGVVVVASTSSTPTAPVSGTTYTASATYDLGTALGSGYVVYSGTGTSVPVTGLTAGTQYYFYVYEYNTTSTCYMTPGLAGEPDGTFGASPWTVSSSGNYVVPAGVSSVKAECWGGGGGGGGCGDGSSTSSNGGSGGGGAYSYESLAVSSGLVCTITVGPQGTAGVAGTSGTGGTGGTSSFAVAGGGTCSAIGGGGGGAGPNNGSGTAGGAGTTGTGVLYTGGAGHAGGGGSTYSCSTGGGGAGNGGNGTTGGLCAGGGGGTGGTANGTVALAGGNGAGNATSCSSNTTDHNGDPGGTPGGGGGGGYTYSSGGSNAGGAGGIGHVNVTYTAVSCTAPTSVTITSYTTPICPGNSPGTFGLTIVGGSGTLSYQWYNSAGAIASGGTSSTYAAPALSASNSYYCIVSEGSGCNTTSNTQAITVSTPTVTGTGATGVSSSGATLNGTD